MRHAIGAGLVFLAMISLVLAQSTTINSTNYTPAYANQTINQTLSYINTVNQSAYLVFYPNLTAAYSYLNRAQKLASSSPNGAVAYANLAYSSAQSQYRQIGTYRTESIIAMLFLTIILLAWTYTIMKRVAPGKSK